MASVITLQALHGLSDNETVDAVTFDLRWKAACGLPITAPAFHSTTLTYWRRRLAASGHRDSVDRRDPAGPPWEVSDGLCKGCGVLTGSRH